MPAPTTGDPSQFRGLNSLFHSLLTAEPGFLLIPAGGDLLRVARGVANEPAPAVEPATHMRARDRRSTEYVLRLHDRAEQRRARRRARNLRNHQRELAGAAAARLGTTPERLAEALR